MALNDAAASGRDVVSRAAKDEKPPRVDITHPVILKDGELYLVADDHGEIDPAPELGRGLFYRDCRFLCRYALRIGGERPSLLMRSAAAGFFARFELTNPPLGGAERSVAAHALTIARQQTIDDRRATLHDRLSLRNCTRDELNIELRLMCAARFEDIFAVRGAEPERRGRIRRPVWQQGVLRLRYDGADGICRIVDVATSPGAASARVEAPGAELTIPLQLAPQQTIEVDVALHVMETEGEPPVPSPAILRGRDEACAREVAEQWLRGYARVESDDALLDAALERSLSDVRLLTIERENGRFVAAGVPWFVALFGRDSLVPSLQCLGYRRELAAHTLRVLARRQGDRYAADRKEQPGKILHELRVGEMAHLGEITQTPGYGSIDSTILYLITLARHAQWSGSAALFEELHGTVERALEWMDRDGDSDGDGYIDYDNGTAGTPANQGWKDSADAITYPNGELVRGRVALAEVQGYAYLAKQLIAELYARAGESAKAERLNAEADALRRRFNRDFWMEREGCYCLALDKDGRQVAVVSSNPGQVLWSGIADPEKARATATRLVAPDMFTGWGIRTLSEREGRFNPVGYHTGSVWPFDNALICAGFRRYGFDDLAQRLFDALLDAAGHFDYRRLPEFFSGTARRPAAGPARCPRADPVQAWSAGALPAMLVTLLGLEAHGFDHRLRLVRPTLPARVDRLQLKGLRVGEADIDLRLERRAGTIDLSVLHRDGRCEIEMATG